MKFNERVYEILKKIPYGKICTYKIIAEKLNTKAYRAVGNALNKNEYPEKIPCFKIINSSGDLGGYSLGLKEKIKRLKKEGIEIKDNKIDLKKYLHEF